MPQLRGIVHLKMPIFKNQLNLIHFNVEKQGVTNQ